MTDRLALILGLIITAALIADIAFFGTTHVIFLGKEFYALLEWMAFWR
ncbi:hypothetical protein [Pseudodonghicola xiamenensis]|nr:hypothetical protein [Pseudodonghicola xiamenensis]